MHKLNLHIIDKNKASRDGLYSYFNQLHEYEEVTASSNFVEMMDQKVATRNSIIIINTKHTDLADKTFLLNVEHFSLHSKIIFISLFEEEHLMINGIKKGAICFLSANQSLAEISDAIRIVANDGTTLTPALGREILSEIHSQKLVTFEAKEAFSILKQYVDKSRISEIAMTWQKSMEEMYCAFAKTMSILSINKL